MARTQIETLEATVSTLLERVAGLEGWRDETETGMESMGQEMRGGLQQVTANLRIVHNHGMSLDDVVLQHHPENYRDLGYTLNEDASGVAATATPTEETSEEPSTPPPVTVELDGSGSPVVLPL